MTRFFIVMAAVLALLVIVVLIGARQEWWLIPSYAFEIIAVMAAFTWIVFRYLNHLRLQQPDTFGPFYLLSIALKLIAGLVLLGVILWLDSAAAFGNAIIFLVSYSLFTTVEVVLLLGKN